jgi:PPOX class probable F420-dependent enzyme
MSTRTATLTENQRAFLEEPFYGSATTLRADGSPHSTVVWVDVDDEGVSFNTAEGRAKVRHLQRDPRLSLIVIDSSDPYRWLAVSGRAELKTEGAEEQIHKLAKKYLGKDEYPWLGPGEQRISVRIHPEHVDSYGLDE